MRAFVEVKVFGLDVNGVLHSQSTTDDLEIAGTLISAYLSRDLIVNVNVEGNRDQVVGRCIQSVAEFKQFLAENNSKIN